MINNEENKLTLNNYREESKEVEKNQSLSNLILSSSLISEESEDIQTKMERLIKIKKAKGGFDEEKKKKENDDKKVKKILKEKLKKFSTIITNLIKKQKGNRFFTYLKNSRKKKQNLVKFAKIVTVIIKKKFSFHLSSLLHEMKQIKKIEINNEEKKVDNKPIKAEDRKNQEQNMEEALPIHVDNFIHHSQKKGNSKTKNLAIIENKKKLLEEKKNYKKQYLSILENQLKENEEDIKRLENQIRNQQIKAGKIEEGLSVSMTESLSMSFNSSKRIENGLELLNYFVTSNIQMKKIKIFNMFLTKYGQKPDKKPKRFGLTKKPSNYFDSMINNKMNQRRNMFFNIDEEDKETDNLITNKNPRKYKKENSTRINYRLKQINDIDIEEGKEEEFPISPKQKTIREMKKKTTQREEDKAIIKEEDGQTTDRNKVDLNLDNEEDTLYDSDEEIMNEDSSQLMEYDKFYKEQFFKDEIFKFDPKLKDKEEDEIKQEINRMELKKEIKDKQKIRDVNAMKGLDTSKLDKEIAALKEQYSKKKKVVTNGVELQMNNTDTLLYKGRLLYNYFHEKQQSGIPKFSIENERNMKGKEIIDFKPLSTEEEIRRFYDKCPCLKCRKEIFKWYTYAKYYCNILVDNFIFENISLLVIITNTILILISDPRNTKSIANTSDSYFLYFYTLEAALKIIGFGFLTTDRAYLKDYWNILDFFVIIMGWISFILERAMNGKKISGLAGLRAFRILRPLKTVKSIKGLRRLVIALLASLSKLSDISIVLFFFFLIFAIAGVQMWQGLFLRRCMSLNFGYLKVMDGADAMCTFDSDCEDYNEPGNRFICAKGFINPSNGVITFDNTLTGFMTVFILATLEGWTDIWTYVSKTFKDKYYINPVIIFFYFHVFVFVGGFYLINLFLAVTNSEFTNIEKIRKELTSKKSFFLLIKSKYDLKEKEKQEKKKKEKELKSKNQRKTGETLYEMKYKIEEEAFHIRKNQKDIPINYTTIKDMYILQNNNPEELHTIDKAIKHEEKYLKNDIKKQIKNIDAMLKQKKAERKRMLNQLEGQSSRKSGSTLHDTEDEKDPKYRKRKPTQMLVRPVEKIYPLAVDIAINYTQKYLKEEMVNLQKMVGRKKTETADILRQKIEKKEMEKFNMNQISILEDLSFEKEKKKDQEKETKELQKKKQRKEGFR